MKSDSETPFPSHPTDPSAIRPGDVIAIVTYARVVANLRYNQTLQVQDLDRHGTPFEIKGDELARDCFSADRFAEEVKLARTKICKILMTRCWGVPFTACFVKENGEERVMRCRYLENEETDGRSRVEDLDVARGENRVRLIDHRTLKWLIVRGVKYVSNSRK